MKTKTKLSVILLALSIIVIPAIGLAQNYTLLEPIPCIPSANNTTCTSGGITTANGNLMSSVDFQSYMQYAFNLVIALAAAAAVFMIVLGGLQYMTTYSEGGKSAGLEKAKNALYGLILVLGSYLILRTIDPRLVTIPSTLVAPLNIKTTSSTITGLLGTLDTQTSSLSAANKTILANVTAAQTQITNLEGQKIAKCNELDDALANQGLGGNPNNCDDLLAQASENNLSQDLVTQIYSINEQINTQQINVATQVGIGVMNDEILKCAAGEDFATCQNMILGFKTNYDQKLGSLSSDPALQSKLNDYARYAASMAYVNSQVSQAIDNASITPFQAALQTSFVGATTIVGGATGAVVGGVVSGGTLAVVGGGAAGTVAYNAASNITDQLNQAKKNTYTTQAINNIQNYTASMVASITDPQLKQATQAEIDAVIAGLKK